MSFNILVELPEAKVDWVDLSNVIENYKEFIDFFPIPSNKIFKKNHLGLSVNQPVSDAKREAVINVIEKFLSINYKVSELYSHKIFTRENVKILVLKFL